MIIVNYQMQTGSMDCIPVCFRNALIYFGVPVSPALRNRLQVFNSGTVHCSVFSTDERIAEAYGKSIDKLMAEWNWFRTHGKHDTRSGFITEENWASDLIENGIELDCRNGPIEQRSLILDSLHRGSVCICEISKSTKSPGYSGCKHAILLLHCINGKLIVHDPETVNVNDALPPEVRYGSYRNGANCIIDCDFFFSNASGSFKPLTNTFQQDCGYRFILISKRSINHAR